MEYSVEQIATLANISVRTLHYYDEIDLLKPIMRLKNGKRYYGIEQLMQLMNIFFFKKMGLSLKKIKVMLTASNADKTTLLALRKQFLQKEIKRLQELVELIDATEFYAEGDHVKAHEILKQFENFQNNVKAYKKEFEKEFEKFEEKQPVEITKKEQQEWMDKYNKHMSHIDKKAYIKRMNTCTKQLLKALNANLKEDSVEVQKLIHEYLDIIKLVSPTPQDWSKKQILTMSINTGSDRDVYALFCKLHPKFPNFLSKALHAYAEKMN